MIDFFKRLLSSNANTESSKRFIAVCSAFCLWFSLFLSIALFYATGKGQEIVTLLVGTIGAMVLTGIGATTAENIMGKKDNTPLNTNQ